MQWEDALLSVFEDLEQQAQGAALSERDAAVADLATGEYATVSLVARLHASTGLQVTLRLLGGRVVTGSISRVGPDWVLLTEDGYAVAPGEWLVPVGALVSVMGASARALSEPARSVLRRLSLRSALRGIAQSGRECVVHARDGQSMTGMLGRIGEDFAELHAGVRGPVQLVPISGVAALQAR